MNSNLKSTKFWMIKFIKSQQKSNVEGLNW
jgi:hypothetical protein